MIIHKFKRVKGDLVWGFSFGREFFHDGNNRWFTVYLGKWTISVYF